MNAVRESLKARARMLSRIANWQNTEIHYVTTFHHVINGSSITGTFLKLPTARPQMLCILLVLDRPRV